MQHTDNRLQTHWLKVSEFIAQNWPRITSTELKNIDGNYDKFLFYLKEHYQGFPMTEAVARDKILKFLNKLDA